MKTRNNILDDNITVTLESEDDDVPESEFIKSIIGHACQKLDKMNAHINVQIVDDETMAKLNGDYRGKHQPTNVLSFASDLPEWIDSPLLGDIVICPKVVTHEALQFNKSLNSRWAHMLVHGVLHLFGMTHDNKTTQNQMEKMEQNIMNELGYDNPYQVTQ